MKNTKTQPSNIVLAVDGSDYAFAAAQLLDDFIGKSYCQITIIAVLDTPHTPRRQLLLDALDRSKEIISKPDREISVGLLHGNPAACICDYADSLKPDLIVLGAVGRRATLGILLGGVAQQVIEYAHFPVLVARPPYHGLSRVLVATDGSVYSRKALHFLGCLSLVSPAELHIVHVSMPYPSYETPMGTRSWLFGNDVYLPPTPLEESDNWKEAMAIASEAIIADARREIQPCGIQPITQVLNGDAATEILGYAKRSDIDLIVIGSRGLSQVKGWLLGSVSRKLVHYSNRSVLVVKSDHNE